MYTDTYTLMPRATPARSVADSRPAIAVSMPELATIASCAMNICHAWSTIARTEVEWTGGADIGGALRARGECG
jgi:hypothetical protein